MVEVFVPFLLIMMNWNPQDPSASMEVTANLYISQDECAKAGADIAAMRVETPVPGTDFAWRCERAPSFIEKYVPQGLTR